MFFFQISNLCRYDEAVEDLGSLGTPVMKLTKPEKWSTVGLHKLNAVDP
jgi:hypothetical protein